MMTRQVVGKRKCEELSWLLLGQRFWGHSSGLKDRDRASVQVTDCFRRGGKQELVNASFLALIHYVELYFSTSGFLLLVEGGLPYLLGVPLLSGAAAGQSAWPLLHPVLWNYGQLLERS